MHRQLFWKLFVVFGMGIVVLFYLIDVAISRVENDMSSLSQADRAELSQWRAVAQGYYERGELSRLEQWLQQLQDDEQVWAAVAQAEITHIAGSVTRTERYTTYNMGRDIEHQIHLWFKERPIMELPFSTGEASLLVELPARMYPGYYWKEAQIALQVILPVILLVLLVAALYWHIMAPLRELQKATRSFSRGQLDARVGMQLGARTDEIAQLANTFDHMAARIGDLILTQRQLITDLSHELRTPLTRLDISVDNIVTAANTGQQHEQTESLARIRRESQHIRKLVDDTLTFAWLKNEAPELEREQLDLVDLLEVVIEDARFEYPDRQIVANLPDTADVADSNHRLLGQALENILRNALRYTPQGKTVAVDVSRCEQHYTIDIKDEGPGVPEQYLQAIFRPFFRVESSRPASGASFGLGLALAQRQLAAIASSVWAKNRERGGLHITVQVPQHGM